MSWARSTCAFSFARWWGGGDERIRAELQRRRRRLYAPQLMLGVWLYAYAGITSARQSGTATGGRLAFRYLAAGERVDNWAPSAFRRRHSRALNDAFTQVLEWAVAGHGERVAIDLDASRPTLVKIGWTPEQALRNGGVVAPPVRSWQKAADARAGCIAELEPSLWPRCRGAACNG